MKARRKGYQKGGPIDPNYQTLGNIKFDSNVARDFGHYLVVKDENTGKDFGVIRDPNTGKYDWYVPKKRGDLPRPTEHISTDLYKRDKQILEQGQWLQSYISSSKYKERLKREGVTDPEKEVSTRKNNLTTTKVDLVNSIGSKTGKILGDYNPSTHKVRLESTGYASNPTVATHELSHASLRASERISSGAKNLINNSVVPVKESHWYSRYVQDPTEFISRMQSIRYLLNKEKIHDASIEEFTPQQYNRMLKNSNIRDNSDFKDMFDQIKGDTEEERANNFLYLMNNIASSEKNPSVKNAAMGGYINEMKTKRKQTKGYFTGGEIAMITNYASGLANDYTSAFTKKEFDPSADPYKINWSKLSTQGVVGMIPEVIKMMKDKKQRESYVPTATPGNYSKGGRIGYAMGGELDEQLSSRAFEVEADPNRIDSKHYPHLNAKLDHGEVVTDNKFVFSNRLKNPQTGETFAEEAEALQKVVGKSEKIKKVNPYDAFANNTININNKRTENLAQLQEALATVMGHRNDRPKGMAYGGFAQGHGDPPYTFPLSRKDMPNDFFTSISPQQWADFTNPVDVGTGQRRRPITADYFIGRKLDPNQAVMDMGRDGMFYDPYTKKFVVRNKKGEYVGVQPNAGQFEVSGDIVKDLTTGKTFNTKEHLEYMKAPKMQSAGPEGPTLGVPSNVLQNIEGAGAAPLVDPLNPFIPRDPGLPKVTPAPPQGGSGKGRVKPKASGNPKAPFNTAEAEYDRAMYEEMQAAANRNLPIKPIYDPETDEILMDPITSSIPAKEPNIAAALNFGKGTSDPSKVLGDELRNKFTAGDALQALEVASKFGQLIGGADVEMPNFDTTRITKETFDPRNALYQSNRTLQNALNTMEAPSVNMRRNMANSLYAQRLGQDNTILSEYNRMNQGANTQFEQRQADQRRYNIGQTNYTEDLNQRNKDTYRNAVQNAFTSLGNFGEGLNQKKVGTDALNILKKSYPQVYQRIMETWLEEEKAAKKTKKEG